MRFGVAGIGSCGIRPTSKAKPDADAREVTKGNNEAALRAFGSNKRGSAKGRVLNK